MPLPTTTADVPAATETDFAALMEEPPGGHNYGRALTDTFVQEEPVDLGVEAAQLRDLLAGGGWGILHPERHGRLTGMTARTTDEYVDADALRAAVETTFGFTLAAVHSVYARGVGGGPLPKALRELRGRIDARLLALSRAGTNMQALARALGLPTDDHGCEPVKRALARARATEVTT